LERRDQDETETFETETTTLLHYNSICDLPVVDFSS